MIISEKQIMHKYLFVNYNNGHQTTYHPFLSDIELSNEDARKIQLQEHPGATRIGTDVNDILNIIVNMGFTVANYIHPCYDIKAFQIYNPNLTDWRVIEGISGNY